MGLTAVEADDFAAADRYWAEPAARFAKVVEEHPSIDCVDKMCSTVRVGGDEN